MAGWFFHSTSDGTAHAIRRAGAIRAGLSRTVYLSLDLYDRGHLAADRLSTHPAVPREMVIAIPEEVADELVGERQSSIVEPIDVEGRVLTTDDGREVIPERGGP